MADPIGWPVHILVSLRGDWACQHGWTWARLVTGGLAGYHLGLEAWVATGVLDQVVTAHEALVTQWALEALLACVGPDVACQLI